MSEQERVSTRTSGGKRGGDDEETEENRAFIDDDDEDDLEEEDDLSFYRRVDLQFPERRQVASPAAPVQSTSRLLKKRKRLLTDLYRHLTELVVVGFNSSKYDLNVLKDIRIPYLVHRSGIDLAIKRHHTYLALRTGVLKLVDISNFVAADTSYGAFLKAYRCHGEKGFLPYEDVRSLSQLEEPQLPPREAFHSWLRKSELIEEDYVVCQRAWTEKGMRTVQDCLIWNNNLDVVPFLEALDKMSQFWRRHGVDMLKEASSLPGLDFKFEVSFLTEQGLLLSSFHTEDLYQLFKDGRLGRRTRHHLLPPRRERPGQNPPESIRPGRPTGAKSGRLRRQYTVLVNVGYTALHLT